MATLYTKVKSQRILVKSFRKVREHAIRSPSRETREALAEFEKDLFGSIHKLQKRLGKGNFEFYPQRGIAKRKSNSPDYRPLVVAPFEDRIVQRAILEVLIAHVPAVRDIMRTATSLGGIPGRGVKSAVDLIATAVRQGVQYYVRSDIEGFFTKIPKHLVRSFVEANVKDQHFLQLFNAALETELENLEELQEHKSLFPIGDEGVAQGSALSTLAGNIVLNEFDRALNGRNIFCIRYVDDYILLGPDKARVRKAFESSQELLGKLNMRAYSPWDERGKAEQGPLSAGFSFLGCEFNPKKQFIQPSRKARLKLLTEVKMLFDDALHSVANSLVLGSPADTRQRYAQAIVKADAIVSGWKHAFLFCDCNATFESLDYEIDRRFRQFDIDFRKLLKSASLRATRYFFGVRLLRDVPLAVPTNNKVTAVSCV